MPKIDIDSVKGRKGSSYPEPFRTQVGDRERKALGDAIGLTQFGVNLMRLTPGAMSSMRHWHENEDEFVFVVSGEVVLVEDDGETVLRSGDAAGWQAGAANGHHLINRSSSDVLLLEVGTRGQDDEGHYPDVDLAYHKKDGKIWFTRKDGSSHE